MSKRYVITYEYNFEGGTQTSEFSFKLPMKIGTVGLEVQILKYFLELGEIDKVDSTYDVITQTAVQQFQDTYRDQIYEKAGWTLPGNVTIDLPGEFINERGTVGDPTYQVMVDNGFLTAARMLLESPEFQRVAETETTSAHRAFETKSERQEPPKIVNKNVEYTYITRIKRPRNPQPDDSHINNKLGALFREAVLKVFDYYGKEKTWTVDGAPRTQGLDQLYELIGDDGDYERKQYEKILQYQRRTDRFRQNQKWTFTVERMSFDDQMNSPRVDVLFGQDLTPGATPIFASITEIIYPTLRPSSTYSIKITIRRDMFDLIAGSTHRGGTIDITDPENYNRMVDGFNQAKSFIENDLGKPFSKDFLKNGEGKFKDSLNKWSSGKRRQLEKAGKDALRNAWNKDKGALYNESMKNKIATANSAAMTAKRLDMDLGDPIRVEYKVKNLINHINSVSKKIKEFAPDIEAFREKNRPSVERSSPFKKSKDAITPYFNVDSEADRLKKVEQTLGNFLQTNGYSIKVGPSSEDKIEIFFEPVRKELPTVPPENEELTPNIDENPRTGEKYKAVVGYRIIRINYINPDGEIDELTSGMPDFQTEDPFTSPTTMGYLVALQEMYDDVSVSDPCVELESSPAIEFFSKYHWPILTFNFNQKTESMLDIKINFDPGSLLTAAQEFEEASKMIQSNIDNLLASTFAVQKGKSITSADLVPDFGEIPCDIEEMWKQFLNKWNMSFILCDFLKCVPSLGPWNFDFDWKLPTLPKIPSFDPLQFVIPQIKIVIMDLILSFLCAILKMILDSIRFPDCVDLLKFGALTLSELNKSGKDNPFANASQKASLFEKTADTIKNMGIPTSALNSESEDSIGVLLDSVSLVLTPYELCSLLEGKASDEVLQIVLNVVQATSSTLRVHLSTTNEIRMFFETLGQVVDPFLCQKIKQLENVSIATELCPESDSTDSDNVRRLLESVGASPEEVAQELSKANDRKKVMHELAKNGDFSSLMPGMDPKDLKDAGLPGPYNNQLHDKLVKMAIESTLDNVKAYYDVEIAAFPDIMVTNKPILVRPGSPTFNPLDYIMYRHYLKQIENVQNQEPAVKVGELKPYNFEGQTSATNQEAVNYYMEVGIPEEEYRYMKFYVKHSGSPDDVLINLEDMKFEKAQEFGELVEKYVTGYLQKYMTQDPEILGKLKNILSLDQTTITRKFPGGDHKYRELHVRLMTEKASKEPMVVDSSSNVPSSYSVGYSDLAFLNTEVKDCYRVSYANIPGVLKPPNQKYFRRVYKDDLPEAYSEFRKTNLDIVSDIHDDKLLRPGGFASFLVEKYDELANGSSNNNTFDTYRAGNPADIIPKLQGYVEALDQEQIDALLEQVSNLDGDEGTSLGELLIGAILAALIQGGTLLEQELNPLYSSVSDSINFSISQMTKYSRYFDYEELVKFKDEISRQYNVSSVDGKACYVPNDKVLDFKKLVNEFLENYKKEVQKPERDPTKRDFNENGPFEDAMIENLLKVYVGVASLEMLLKGIFLFSNFGAERIFDQQFIVDYLVEYTAVEFENSLIEKSTKDEIFSILKKSTGVEDGPEALRTAIIKNLKIETMVDFINRIFSTDHKSYKEKFYNDLANNIKDIPSVYDFPKVAVRTASSADGLNLETSRNFIQVLAAQQASGDNNAEEIEIASQTVKNSVGYSDVPISYMFPNLRDKFRFEGDDEATINKRINSGHFWVEKFFKIGEFSEFIEKYNDLKTFSENEDVSYPKLRNVGTAENRSLYSEYLSPEDLELLLYGAIDSNDEEEILRNMSATVAQNRAEYEFIKHVYLTLLGAHFAPYQAGSDINRWRDKNSIVYLIMNDLGMTKISPSLDDQREHLTENGTSLITDTKKFRPRGVITTNNRGSEIVPAGTPSGDQLPNQANWNPDYITEHPWQPEETRDISEELLVSTEPSPLIASELDLAFVEGDVTRRELYERAYSRIKPACDAYFTEGSYVDQDGSTQTYDKDYPDVFMAPLRTTWEKISDDSLGLSAAWKGWGEMAGHWYFFPEAYVDVDKFAELPLERKVQIFVDCLIEFMDIKNNWPISDQDFVLPNDRRIIMNKGQWRGEYDPNLANKEVEVMSIVSHSRLAVEYPNNWMPAGENRWDLSSGSHMTSGSPKYDVTDFSQNVVLEHYIRKVYKPMASQSTNITEATKSGAFNLLPIFQEFRRPISLTSALNRKKAAIYQHLENNLKVGYRLMFGHKVAREELTNFGAGIGDRGDTVEAAIMPSDIYGDLLPEIDINSSVQINNSKISIGTEREGHVFTKKRCFLGHIDDQPIMNDTRVSDARNFTSLNLRSCFYDNAAKILSTSAFSTEENPIGTEVKPVNQKIMSKLAYSIPLDETFEHVDCFEKLFREYSNVESGREPVEFVSPSSAESEILVRRFLREGIFENYKDKLLETLLSLEAEEKGTRKIKNINSYFVESQERMKAHRVMFDFLFPLDRFAALHFLQNVLVFDSESDSREIFTATKLFIIQSMLLMNNIASSENPKPQNAMGTLADNAGSSPAVGDVWAMIFKQLAKLAEQSANAAVRKIAETVDPAYKDMRKQYKDNPCSMGAGLRPGLLGAPMQFGWSEQYSGNKLDKGFGTKGGCKSYVPANMFPVDLMFSIVPAPYPPFINLPLTATNMATTAEHFVNLFVPGAKKRYGYPLTPFGMLGLSVGELPGEEHVRLKREQECQEGCVEKDKIEPMAMCEDLENSEQEE